MPARYRLKASVKGYQGEAFVDVPSGRDVDVVITVESAAVLSFEIEAPSPSDVVVYEIAQDDGPWRTLMRHGGELGKIDRYETTLAPGRWRWRVTFPSGNFSGSGLAAAEPAEGEVTVGVGETARIAVPVITR